MSYNIKYQGWSHLKIQIYKQITQWDQLQPKKFYYTVLQKDFEFRVGVQGIDKTKAQCYKTFYSRNL